MGRRLARDESGVSEVVGFILVFAIISIVLVLGMLAFNKAQSDARRNVVDLRMQSVGTRVAALVVDTSLAAEQEGPLTAVRYLADLPPNLEGASYTVYLEPRVTGAGAHDARVRVHVDSLGLDETAPIFSADRPATIQAVCAGSGTGTSATGGRILIGFNIAMSGSPDVDTTYPKCLFVRAAP